VGRSVGVRRATALEPVKEIERAASGCRSRRARWSLAALALPSLAPFAAFLASLVAGRSM